MPKQKRRKKGIKKKGLLIVGFLLTACIVIAAVFFLIGQNSSENKQYEAKLKLEAKEFTEGLITELDQIDTSEEGLNANTSENNTTSPTEVPSGVITEAEKQVIGEELEKLEDKRKQKVLQTLSVAYSQALNQQKLEALSMLESLIAQGKKDWAALVARGENTTVNKGKLASEYLAKSKAMEEQMDASFSTLVSKMEDQLTAEGIDPTAIIEQYRAEYQNIKEENRKALMEKVMAAVNQ